MQSVAVERSTTDKALSFFAWSVLAFMVLVVLWGAVVRATGSGAGCGNHWPLCNGDFFPHHPRLATVIEFTHRSMSGILTALVAALVVWVFYQRPAGHGVRRAVVWVGILLVSEALLGAVLVKGAYVEGNTSNARVVMQCIHFSNTMLLLAALTLTAWRVRSGAIGKSEQRNKALVLACVGLTILVGATGAVAALADTLFPSPSLEAAFSQDFATTAPLIVRMRWIHPASSMLAIACVAVLCGLVRNKTACLVAGLMVLQIVLGIADVLLLAPTWMQMLHLLGADLYWIALIILCDQALTFTSRTLDAQKCRS